MLTAFLLIFHLGIVNADEIPRAPHEGRYSVGLDGSYFWSSANYGHDGGSHESFGGDYSEWSLRPRAAWEMNSLLRFYGSLGYLSVESTGTPGSSAGSGMSDAALGAQAWMDLGGVRLVPQADFVMPLYRVDKDSNNALLGEGAMTIQGGSWLLWSPVKPVTLFGFAGFRHRDEGRSFLLPYDLGLNYRFSPGGWWLQGGLRGYQTVVDDTDTDFTVERDAYLAKANGGTFRYFQINPSTMELNVETGRKFARGEWGFYVGNSLTLSGESSAHGLSVYGGLAFYGGRGESDAYESSDGFMPGHDVVAPLPVEKQAPIEKFKTPEPKYDESLFKDEVEVGRPPVEKLAKPKAAVKAKPKPAVQAKPKALPTVQMIKKKRKKKIDKAIEDAERALENKK